MLTVNEIFYSIQGESSFSGCPCVFVRLTACDLRCSWCDTTYAFDEGDVKTLDEIMERVSAFNCPLIEISGGEPLLQDDVYSLMQRLLDAGKTVLVETGGHIDISRVPDAVVKVVDIKCPGSGESSRTCWTNLELLSKRDELKFVIKDRADYEFARDVIGKYQCEDRCGGVLFSPVHGVLDPADLSSWILSDRLNARVQIQLHKYIWGEHTRGV